MALDRLTSLEVFAKVAATGSFSAAGRAMRLSQTMVTKHIAALEGRIGVKLFHRTTRRLSLTEAGRRYLEASTRVLADLEAADNAVAERLEPRGVLRLNAPVSFGVRQIAPRLPDFAALCPHVSVDLGLNDRLVDLADEGWDLAVRIGQLNDSSLIARRIAVCRTVVCSARSYLQAQGTPRTVAELANHNCLSYTLSRRLSVDRWAFGIEGEIVARVSGNLVANNGSALRAAAIAGQGIIYQPTFIVADDLRSGALIALELDHPTIETAIYAVYLPAPHPPAKVRAFIDFLATQFAPEPPWDRF
jgi:DNA-binding transcriptional LysR family regulator